MIKIKITALLVLIVAFFVGFFIYNNEPALNKTGKDARFPFQLGLDLAGGTQLVYKADVSEIDKNEIPDAMQTLKDVIERRINPLGQEETNVQIQEANFVNEGEYRIIIELPGVTDISVAKKKIGETPILEFKTLKPGVDITSLDPLTTTFDDIYDTTTLTGRYLKSAKLQFNQTGTGGYNANQAVVVLQFDEEGSDIFAQITKDNLGKEVAIFLDGVPISSPTVQEEITGGEAVVSGNFTPDEGKELARKLNFGALPLPIQEIATQTIGASLGNKAIDAGMKAGVIGLVVLSFYFLIWYRLPGLVAILALSIYGIVMFALFKVIPVTLTAAGIAGFIISLGIAIDANVLIFERLKEELKTGKSLRESINEGFRRAWPSIRDSNFSSILTAIILFWFGSALIKGFAITFGLGVVVSMISAISVTRLFLLVIARNSEKKYMKKLFTNGFNN